MSFLRLALVLPVIAAVAVASQSAPLPQGPLAFGAFTGQFRSDGTFTIAGQGWPPLNGTWKADGAVVELLNPTLANCSTTTGRYRFAVAGTHLTFDVVADACQTRRMILDRSDWRPASEPESIPPRRILRTTGRLAPLRAAPPSAGSWPSFRGTRASGIADGQQLPDQWDVKTGKNVLWRTPIPGLAHSSPVAWGDRVFVTTAISSEAMATFKPGLYGDGDASADRSPHRWVIYAIDRRTGRVEWERTAHEGAPLNKRHIKSTYASASPATDGRIVVAWFGSQGVHAYDVDGTFRWKVDLGRVDMGAYDIPTFEWGPASSPIIWNDLVIVQCDTQADSFLIALNAATGETVWKTERDELPSWGTPTVVETATGEELVTNASNFIRGYDPRTGQERWRLSRSSKITAPTPIAADNLIVVASGRGPERPVFVVRPGARGDITPAGGATTSASVVWSKTGRGSYMPTPIVYGGLLYVLANNGLFDAYTLATGDEVYRQRLPHLGSGFSASPVAADGKIYIAGEDGEIIVVTAGADFKHLATNSMGEPLMATPALSRGVMFVRSSSTLFAIGRQQAAPDFSGTWRLDPSRTTVTGSPPSLGGIASSAKITAPIKIRHVSPTYPDDALRARITGMVIIRAVIDRQGNVVEAAVVKSVPGLDQAALDAVSQWKFTPAMLENVPMVVQMTTTVNFTLGGPMPPRGTGLPPGGRPGGGGANVQVAEASSPQPDGTLKITQDASTMTIAGMRDQRVTYRFDGRDSRNTTAMGLSGDFTYVSKWDGATLQTEITTPTNTDSKRVERRWLDGEQMIVETTLTLPGAEPLVTRHVFVKGR